MAKAVLPRPSRLEPREEFARLLQEDKRIRPGTRYKEAQQLLGHKQAWQCLKYKERRSVFEKFMTELNKKLKARPRGDSATSEDSSTSGTSSESESSEDSYYSYESESASE